MRKFHLLLTVLGLSLILGCSGVGGGTDTSLDGSGTGSGGGTGGGDVGSALAAPEATTATPSLTSILVQWNPVSGATGYVLYRGPSPSDPCATVVSSLQTGTTRCTDSSLTFDTTYCYEVTSLNGTLESIRSNRISAKTSSTLPPPTDVKVIAETSSSLTVSWSPVADAAKYYVYREGSAEGTFSSSIGAATSTLFEDNGLAAGKTYYYKVAAAFDVITSDKSAYASGTTTTLPMLAPPGNAGATRGTSTTKITVTWSPAATATGYNVYRGTTLSLMTKINASPLTTTAYDDTPPHNGTDYYYHVTSVRDAVESGASSSVIGYTRMTAPVGLSASRGLHGHIVVSWSAVADAESYDIYEVGGCHFETSSASFDCHVCDTRSHSFYVTATGKECSSTSAQSQTVTGYASR
jgi:fibronectin type 3 domain-containing protein